MLNIQKTRVKKSGRYAIDKQQRIHAPLSLRVMPHLLPQSLQQYEIRVISDCDTIYVRAFCNGKPANGYRYSANLITAMDLERVLGYGGVKDLIDTAKTEVIEGRWDKYLAACSGSCKTSNECSINE